MATTVLKMFFSSGKVPAAIKPTLDKILSAKARLADISTELSRISRLKRELAGDQSRIRSNLDLLRKVKGQIKQEKIFDVRFVPMVDKKGKGY